MVAIYEVITAGGGGEGGAEENKKDNKCCCEGEHYWQSIFGWLVLVLFLIGSLVILGTKRDYRDKTPKKPAVGVSNNVRSEPETSQNLRSDLGNHGSSMREEQSQ